MSACSHFGSDVGINMTIAESGQASTKSHAAFLNRPNVKLKQGT